MARVVESLKPEENTGADSFPARGLAVEDLPRRIQGGREIRNASAHIL